MQTWLRSLVDAILDRVVAKTSRPDTATCMMINRISASAASQNTPRPPGRAYGMMTPCESRRGLLADVAFLEELTSIIREAQHRDAEAKAGCIAHFP
jgi:hypothetical protein